MDIDVGQLQAVSDILHLLHHRNKNQHRQSAWWKWLSMLKRCVVKLISELGEKNTKRTQARVLYMKDVLFPRSYLSFTQVVQDKQFSALGLILVAELARIRRVVGFDLEEGEVAEDAEGKLVHGKSFLRSRGSEDLGEAVGRSTLAHPSIRLENSASAAAAPFGPCITGNIELSLGPAKGSPDVVGATMESALLLDPQGEERPAASKPQGSPKSAKRKRRKPANPIDDLFLGLD